MPHSQTAIVAAILTAVLGLSPADSAPTTSPKSESTPCFWQRDPDANFDNDGRNHCAPASVSDALVYLTTARGYKGLVKRTDHQGQIDLITDLAALMDTDPKAGTNPDKILTGLKRYVQKQGFTIERLELASWRGVGSSNKNTKIGDKPSLSWAVAAAKDPDCLEIFNFGWYVKGKDGKITREGGHWVNVVGTGPGASQFDLRNPILETNRQKNESQITLKLLDKSFLVSKPKDEKVSMSGYYAAQGPGLPFNPKAITAVLDSVIALKLKKGD